MQLRSHEAQVASARKALQYEYMSMPDGFWWNWGVAFATAVGTIGAVVLALFGKRIQVACFPPNLKLSLTSQDGEGTTTIVTPPGGRLADGRPEAARYYHLQPRKVAVGTAVSRPYRDQIACTR